jgi:hypothetical protein
VTNNRLAASYIDKPRKRRKALDVLFSEGAYSDVVREAQAERALNDARFVVDVVGRLRDATSGGG